MHRLLRLTALAAALAAVAAAQTVDFVRFLKAPRTPAGSGIEVLPTPSAIAAGRDGSTYVVGNVRSATLPVTGGVVQPEWAGSPLCGGPRNFFPCADAFAARISSDGRILFATYLGGRGDDFAHDVAVDSEGNAYVTGFTGGGLPFLEGSGAFVLKLSPDGSQVLWSTTLAGGEAIALAPGGGVVVAGRGPQVPTSLGEPEAAPLFRTGDEQIWKPVNRGLPPSDVTDLAIVSEGRMFAVARGLFRSDDFGDTWRELALGLPVDVDRGELPLTVAVHPENPSLVLAGTFGQGVARSQDGGATWTDSSAGLPLEIRMSIRRLVFAPSDPSRAYLAGQVGQEFAFFRSSDAGVNWTRLSDPNREGFASEDIGALVVDPSNPDKLYLSLQGTQFGVGGRAAAAAAVFRSDDAGATWRLLRYGLEAIGPLIIDQSNPEILYAGTHLGFEISRDGGLTWTVSNPAQLDPSQLSPTVGTAVTAIARDASDGTIFAASPSGVFRTANRGQTWRRLSARSARSFDLLAVTPRPGQPRLVFAALRHSTHGQADVSKLSRDGQFLEWSVSFGGSNDDRISDLVVAGDGAVWITGTTESIDFPVVNGLQSAYPGGGSSAFLSKLVPDGSALVFSTFLGGERVDQGASLALEPSGAVVVAGTTFSPDFPVVFAGQRRLAGESDAFLARLRSDASAFDFATYAGGPDLDRGLSVAIDSNGRLILAGETEPADAESAEIPSNSTPGDITVTRFNSSGRSELQLRLGGGSFDFLNGGLAIDPNDRLLLGGFTNSDTFGIISAAGVATPGNSAFVAALDLDREGAAPEITSVENGASFLEGPIAPGEILTIRGRNLGPRQGVLYAATAEERLAADLSGVRVWIGGLAATPLYVQGGQINVVAPYGIEAGSSAEIVVETAVGRSEPTQREVVEAVPGWFTADATGIGPVAALDETLRRISPANPAAPSGYVVLYATGLGRIDPALADGLLTPLEFPIPAPALPVEVEIGGLPAHIDWIGAAPTLPGGIVQINVRLSGQVLPNDQQTVRLIVAGQHSQDGVTLAVR